MTKYKCNHNFHGSKEKLDFEEGKSYDFSPRRAKEIIKTVTKKYGIKDILVPVIEEKEVVEKDKEDVR